ncbi:MAG: hypothetical protein K2M04_05240 [Muribaculaceae bacterium]|nr:hypothetical protein [Muribaculaceae bacterium]
MNNSRYTKWALGVAVAVLGITAVSCDDQPDKFEMTGGVPTIKYVRVTTPESGDSLITGAYMENTICLVGDNLRSIHEMYFNDQKAILNTSLITDHTLIVDVPKNIPEDVTDKIYMHTRDGEIVTYDFNVLVPGPAVRSISCEWTKPGNEATIYGDYFIDDPNKPLKITFSGNVELPYENIKKITKTAITFEVPENWTEGYMNVTTLYGTSRSSFKFHDTTNILFDWDGNNGGLATGHGWRGGVIHQDGDDEGVEALDGGYLFFSADLSGEAGATWAEDGFSFNYWPDASGEFGPLSSRPEFADLISDYGVDGLQIKFEMCIPASNPWSSCAMQIIFTGDDAVTYDTANNTYISDENVPRGLYNPWKAVGSYDTGGNWTTVSMPLSQFTFKPDGGVCGNKLNQNMLTGLTFFVWSGGVSGTDCTPVILLDNIRVVPVE